MSSKNPYEPLPSHPIHKFAKPVKRRVWIAIACISSILPPLLIFGQRAYPFPNHWYLPALLTPILVATICLSGWGRLWGSLLGVGIFFKFTILSVLVDFMLYGFDGVQ